MAKLGDPITLTWILSAAAVLGFGAYAVLPRPQTIPISAPEQPTVPETDPASLSDQLPDFTLAQLGGAEANLHSWLGRPLVINFWATWCAPCLREIPLLVAFQSQQQPDGIQIIGVAVDRTDAVEKFATSMDFNYPNLMGESDAMEAAATFGAEFFALPFTVFADASGRILAVNTGEIHQGDLDNFAAVIADLNLEQTSVSQARARLAGNL
jgi:thiol-disulfide isomerase/thioredoxin